MVAFARADFEACSQKLLSVWEATWSWLENEDLGCRKAAESALCAMVRYCITDAEIVKAVEVSTTTSVESNKKGKKNNISPELKATVIGSLLFRLNSSLHAVAYAKATPSLLSILTALISRHRTPVPSSTPKRTTAAEPLLSSLIVYIGGLRLAKSFEYREKADEVLGMAIRVMGPEVFLSMLPLNIIPEYVLHLLFLFPPYPLADAVIPVPELLENHLQTLGVPSYSQFSRKTPPTPSSNTLLLSSFLFRNNFSN